MEKERFTPSIPGENKVKDNNWNQIMDTLEIKPSSIPEKFEWAADAATLEESPEDFIDRANQWPSNLRNNRTQYYPAQRGADDFFGPFAYSGVRSINAKGIKIPESFKSAKERENFALYTRLIHTYDTNVELDSLKYTDERAMTKAHMNAALLIATVYARMGKKLPAGLKYRQSDKTMMSEICGLIGKKTDGSSMTDKEQAQFIADLADDYVAQIEGRGVSYGKEYVPEKGNDSTYSAYKKDAAKQEKQELAAKVDAMSQEEKNKLLMDFLQSQRGPRA